VDTVLGQFPVGAFFITRDEKKLVICFVNVGKSAFVSTPYCIPIFSIWHHRTEQFTWLNKRHKVISAEGNRIFKNEPINIIQCLIATCNDLGGLIIKSIG
jgi:hypothetical protein